MEKPAEIGFMSPDTFREIFQGSAEGILMVDKEGIIKLANPVSEKMFGYLPGELVGKQMEILIPKTQREAHKQHRDEFKANPAPRRMGMGRDLMAIKKDGCEFPVEVSLSYQKIADSLMVMAFVIDITERKKIEEALKRSEEQLLVYAAELEKKVQMRTEALNKSIGELEAMNKFLQQQIRERKRAEDETRKALARERELNELKSKFVSIASHEFRTPLSTILSSASLVAQYRDKGDLEKIDKHILRIKSSVNHLTSILNDFLSLGRLEEGKVDVMKEVIHVGDFLAEVKEELKSSLKDGQKIIIGCEWPTNTIHTDRRLLRNILFNLVSNASKYSAENKNIYISCHKVDTSIAMEIKDEGIGIPENEIKHLFERFFRASNVTNIQGTGLGLNIVNRYIDLLNGKIDFTSEEGKGSIFTITIPVT